MHYSFLANIPFLFLKVVEVVDQNEDGENTFLGGGHGRNDTIFGFLFFVGLWRDFATECTEFTEKCALQFLW